MCGTSYAQNRAAFYYILPASKVLQPPRKVIDTMQKMYATRGDAPRYKFTEYEKVRKVKLLYRNTKTQAVREMYVCSDMIKCNVSLSSNVPVLDIWQVHYKHTADKSPNEDCISTGTSLKDHRFELDLSRDSIGAPTKALYLPFRGRTWGIGTVPYRMRFPVNSIPVSVTSNLGVVANYGFTWGKALISPRAIVHYSVTAGLFAGLSTADLKKETVTDKAKLDANITNPAVSYGANVILARNNMGLVFSLGFDNNFGTSSALWVYQNKPWIGIGVNLSLGYF